MKTTATKRRRIHRDENTRAKIQAVQLINRLTAHVLGKLRKPMDASQVTAALGLLKKVLPDLQVTNVQSEITHNYAVGANPMTEDEWQDQYATGVEPTKGSTKRPH